MEATVAATFVSCITANDSTDIIGGLEAKITDMDLLTLFYMKTSSAFRLIMQEEVVTDQMISQQRR